MFKASCFLTEIQQGLKEEMKNPSHGETFPNTSTKPASKQHLKQPQSLIYQPSDIPMDLSIKMADVTEKKKPIPECDMQRFYIRRSAARESQHVKSWNHSRFMVSIYYHSSPLKAQYN
jgi:hypothetical protein